MDGRGDRSGTAADYRCERLRPLIKQAKSAEKKGRAKTSERPIPQHIYSNGPRLMRVRRRRNECQALAPGIATSSVGPPNDSPIPGNGAAYCLLVLRTA